jgi:Zn finger protein HypA/HybF involved in hydrogenase expression
MLSCQYCNKICKNKNSLVQHEIRCAKNAQRVAVGFTKETAKTKGSGKNYSGLLQHNKKRKFDNSQVFVENCSYSRGKLKQRILNDNLIKYECVECGLNNEWNNKKIVLQLDHINGVNDDHRLENLRFLCPNCHSQQDTYAAKNRLNPKRKPKKYV